MNSTHTQMDSHNQSSTGQTGNVQEVPEEFTAGPQANFTLLDQMSELKKNQSEMKELFEEVFQC